MKWIALLLCSTVVAVNVHAQGDDEVRKFVAAAQQDLRSQSASSTQGQSQSSVAPMMAAQLRSALTGPNPRDLEAILEQVSPLLSSETLRQEGADLAAKLRSQREEKEKKYAAEIDDSLKQAIEAARSATKPADLDEAVRKLSEWQHRSDDSQSSSWSIRSQNRVGPVLRFVTQWQDYLSKMEMGEINDARSILTDLSNQDTTFSVLPRSVLLAKINALAKTSVKTNPAEQNEERLKAKSAQIEEILNQIATPEDLHPAVDRIRKIYAELPRGLSSEVSQVLQDLGTLDQAYTDFKAGLSTRISVLVPQPASFQPHQNLTAKLRAALIAVVLPRYLGLPDEIAVKAEEGPIRFLNRVTADAVTRQDFLLAAKARATEIFLREGSQVTAENSQAQAYVTACNQEAVQQYTLAVMNYQKALASPTVLIPPKIIGDRLAAIKAAHPQEYQQGFDAYLTPPPATRYLPGMPPNWPPGRTTQSPPPPALEVPAASPRPTAAASPTPKAATPPAQP
jgi:hypothetical protein